MVHRSIVLLVVTELVAGCPVRIVAASGRAESQPTDQLLAARAGAHATVLPIRFLVNDPIMQDALSMSEMDRQAIRNMTVEYHKEYRAIRIALEKRLTEDVPVGIAGTDAEFEWKQKILRDFFDSQAQKTTTLENRLLDALDGGQRQRLEEIELQLAGPSALLRQNVAEKLRLTEQQSAQLAEIRLSEADGLAKLQRQLRSGELSKDVVRTRSIAMQRGSIQQAISLLDQRQIEQWQDLCGAEVTFTVFDLSRELRLRASSEKSSDT